MSLRASQISKCYESIYVYLISSCHRKQKNNYNLILKWCMSLIYYYCFWQSEKSNTFQISDHLQVAAPVSFSRKHTFVMFTSFGGTVQVSLTLFTLLFPATEWQTVVRSISANMIPAFTERTLLVTTTGLTFIWETFTTTFIRVCDAFSSPTFTRFAVLGTCAWLAIISRTPFDTKRTTTDSIRTFSTETFRLLFTGLTVALQGGRRCAWRCWRRWRWSRRTCWRDRRGRRWWFFRDWTRRLETLFHWLVSPINTLSFHTFETFAFVSWLTGCTFRLETFSNRFTSLVNTFPFSTILGDTAAAVCTSSTFRLETFCLGLISIINTTVSPTFLRFALSALATIWAFRLLIRSPWNRKDCCLCKKNC